MNSWTPRSQRELSCQKVPYCSLRRLSARRVSRSATGAASNASAFDAKERSGSTATRSCLQRSALSTAARSALQGCRTTSAVALSVRGPRVNSLQRFGHGRYASASRGRPPRLRAPRETNPLLRGLSCLLNSARSSPLQKSCQSTRAGLVSRFACSTRGRGFAPRTVLGFADPLLSQFSFLELGPFAVSRQPVRLVRLPPSKSRPFRPAIPVVRANSHSLPIAYSDWVPARYECAPGRQHLSHADALRVTRSQSSRELSLSSKIQAQILARSQHSFLLLGPCSLRCASNRELTLSKSIRPKSRSLPIAHSDWVPAHGEGFSRNTFARRRCSLLGRAQSLSVPAFALLRARSYGESSFLPANPRPRATPRHFGAKAPFARTWGEDLVAKDSDINGFMNFAELCPQGKGEGSPLPPWSEVTGKVWAKLYSRSLAPQENEPHRRFAPREGEEFGCMIPRDNKSLRGQGMGEATENLSLAMASQYAGVSETTMRDWVKQMPGVERSSTGSYNIPKETLMAYLATKQRKVTGGRSGTGSPNPPAQQTSENLSVGALAGELIEQLRGERDHFREEYSEAKQRIRDLESEVSQLTKSHTAISSSIIALTHRLETSHESGVKVQGSYGEIIDAEHDGEVHARPVNTQKASKAKVTKKKATTKAKPKKKTAVKAKPKAKAKSKLKKR